MMSVFLLLVWSMLFDAEPLLKNKRRQIFMLHNKLRNIFFAIYLTVSSSHKSHTTHTVQFSFSFCQNRSEKLFRIFKNTQRNQSNYSYTFINDCGLKGENWQIKGKTNYGLFTGIRSVHVWISHDINENLITSQWSRSDRFTSAYKFVARNYKIMYLDLSVMVKYWDPAKMRISSPCSCKRNASVFDRDQFFSLLNRQIIL